jgi:hypothetical protein
MYFGLTGFMPWECKEGPAKAFIPARFVFNYRTLFFFRLIELGKLRISTEEKEKKVPDSEFLRKMKNKAGIIEKRFTSCRECGEEFCQQEACTLFTYDNFRR